MVLDMFMIFFHRGCEARTVNTIGDLLALYVQHKADFKTLFLENQVLTKVVRALLAQKGDAQKTQMERCWDSCDAATHIVAHGGCEFKTGLTISVSTSPPDSLCLCEKGIVLSKCAVSAVNALSVSIRLVHAIGAANLL
jgi:hypothetical protein